MQRALTDDRGETWSRWLMLVVLLVAAGHSVYRRFVIDDAYISFRYARHLVDGHGLVYNVGERVEGYTNFLWTILIAATMRLGLDPGLVAQALGIASSLTLLLVLYRWSLDMGVPARHAWVAPAMLAVNRSYTAWATSGLETRFFTLLIVAAAWRLRLEVGRQGGSEGSVDSVRSRESGRRRLSDLLPPSAVLIALACLARPEGYLAAIVAAGVVLITKRPDRPPGLESRHPWGQALAWVVIVAGVAGMHVAWRLWYYGDLVPNSFHAKVPGLRIVSGAAYLGVFALNHVAGPAAVVAAAMMTARRSLRARLSTCRRILGEAPLVFTGSYLIYVMVVGGDHFEFRFVDPILPFLYLSASILVLGGAPTGSPTPGGVASMRLAASALVLSAAISSFVGFSSFDRHFNVRGSSSYVSIISIEAERAYCAQWERIGLWLRDNASPDESIAITAAGAIPFLSELRTLDMHGINDREIARFLPLPGHNVGHERQADENYVRRRGITYLIGGPTIRPVSAPIPGPNVIEVDFGDFFWYFRTLRPESRIRPSRLRAAEPTHPS